MEEATGSIPVSPAIPVRFRPRSATAEFPSCFTTVSWGCPNWTESRPCA